MLYGHWSCYCWHCIFAHLLNLYITYLCKPSSKLGWLPWVPTVCCSSLRDWTCALGPGRCYCYYCRHRVSGVCWHSDATGLPLSRLFEMTITSYFLYLSLTTRFSGWTYLVLLIKYVFHISIFLFFALCPAMLRPAARLYCDRPCPALLLPVPLAPCGPRPALAGQCEQFIDSDSNVHNMVFELWYWIKLLYTCCLIWRSFPLLDKAVKKGLCIV